MPANAALTMAAAELSARTVYSPEALKRFHAAVADLAQAGADQREAVLRTFEGAL